MEEKVYKEKCEQESLNKFRKDLQEKFPSLKRLISKLRIDFNENCELRDDGGGEYYYCARDEVDEEYPTYYEMRFDMYIEDEYIVGFVYNTIQNIDVGSDKVYFEELTKEDNSLYISAEGIYDKKLSTYSVLRVFLYLADKFITNKYLKDIFLSLYKKEIDILIAEHDSHCEDYADDPNFRKDVYDRDTKKLTKLLDHI